MVFGKKGSGQNKKDYSQVSLDDFSDDESTSNHGGDYNDTTNNNDFEQGLQTQQELMKKQDEGLDILSTQVARLGEMSMGISEELGQQNKLLESMETDLDDAGESLDLVTRKTKEFIQMSGGEKNCMVILTLSVVALILFFLILYT